MEVMDTIVSGPGITSPETPPDITLIDGQDIAYGLLHVQQLKQKYPETRIVFLVNELNSKTIWAAARAGAIRCISKEDSARSLPQTLRAIYEQNRK